MQKLYPPLPGGMKIEIPGVANFLPPGGIKIAQ